ncbi:hypothetical protein ACLB2K_011659 [Fragaria x ananassa]
MPSPQEMYDKSSKVKGGANGNAEDSDEAVVDWSDGRNPGGGQMVGGGRWSDGGWWSRSRIGGILVVADCVTVFEREIGRGRGKSGEGEGNQEIGRRTWRREEGEKTEGGARPRLSKTTQQKERGAHDPKRPRFPSLTLGARLMLLGVRFLRFLRPVLRLLRLCA